MKREQVKVLIELSANVQEADAIIQEEGLETVREKLAFLKGMFDFKIIGRHDEGATSTAALENMDYYAILSAIINEKWEA